MGRMAEWSPAASDVAHLIQALVDGQADIISITTPATPGTDLAVKHGLGRVPRGAWIVGGDPGVNLGASFVAPSPVKTTANLYDRQVYPFFYYITGGGTVLSRYLSMGAFGTALMEGASDLGFVATQAGSIVGLSGNVEISTPQAGETYTLEARVNGVNVFSQTSASLAAGGKFNVTKTQAAGVTNFAAGDILNLFITKSGATAAYDKVVGALEIVYGATTVMTDVSLSGGSVALTIPYDLTGSGTNTNEYMYLRFPVASANLTLAVF